MRTIHAWMFGALSLAVSACGAPESAVTSDGDSDATGASEAEVSEQTEALIADGAKPVETYYSVRRDMRRCMSPMCGGYWVRSINLGQTTCADGSLASECYVAEIQMPDELSLGDGDLIHGELYARHYAGLDVTFGNFDADFVLAPVLSSDNHQGHHYLVYDTGIRCFTTPCPSTDIAALNTTFTYGDRDFSFADRALVDPFADEFSSESPAGEGAVVFGHFRFRFDWSTFRVTRELRIDNVYVTRTYEGPVCLIANQDNHAWAWNVASVKEAEQIAAGSSSYRIEHGTCDAVRTACIKLYAPVCGVIETAAGTTTSTFGNSCEMGAAVTAGAGYDSKATGSYVDGACGEPPVACESNDDCKGSFCGWANDGSRLCKPWAQEGERCEGFVLPAYRSFCAPDLTCVLSEPTGDAGGTCQAL